MRIAVVFVAMSMVGCASMAKSTLEGAASDCANYPEGVIRFVLLSGGDKGEQYEWRGRIFRRIGAVAAGRSLVDQFPDGAVAKSHYWGTNVGHINQRGVIADSLLTSPYAVSPDGKWLAAGVAPAKDEYAPPTRLAIVPLANPSEVKVIDIGSSISSVAWSPKADAIVLQAGREQYGVKGVRNSVAAASGHPIPYVDINIRVIALDGTTSCEIAPASKIPYGQTYLSWASH